jgi:hypothetical protein
MSTLAHATSAEPKSQGFGFQPERSQHHFIVSMPAGKNDKVTISEHLAFEESPGRRALSLALGQEDNKVRVVLPPAKWEAIAEPVKTEFNTRLRKRGLPSGKWSRTETRVSRLLGKELVLLTWAIEDADPSLIPIAIRNWQGLAPEERWWLYTMTNAATGHAITGRARGWRKALRFALTENPVGGEVDRHREEFFSLVREAAEEHV